MKSVITARSNTTFAPNHGYTPPGYIYAGDMPLSAQLRAAADKVNPDFLFAGEGPQDWLMQYYPLFLFSHRRPVRCRSAGILTRRLR